MAPDRLRIDIDDFVPSLLDCHEILSPGDKVFHDPIWGTHRFRGHEVAIIDSPILQRLRRIYQTGYSYLTYPSTTQTRFEHSLGASIVATRTLQAIESRHPGRVDLHPITGDLATLRFAALLHDCGHGFGSHASESLYQWHADLLDAKRSTDVLREAKPSEVLSWFMITSEPFRRFLALINNAYGTHFDAAILANLILGIPFDNRPYIAEIINGPFDVDRVDYTVRDSDYSGVKAGIDLERFFNDIDIALLQDGAFHLVLRSTHPIEQLLFAKVHLFVRVYRHQKVLAADAAVQSLVPIVQANQTTFLGVRFDKVSDYLRITDFDILGAELPLADTPVNVLLTKIRRRLLPVRAIAITQRMLKSTGIEPVLVHRLTRLNEQQDGIKSFQDRVWQAIPEQVRPSRHSILPVSPLPPPLREASQVYILRRGESEARTLNEIFRIDEWLATYTDSHWCGYVFADRKDITEVAVATQRVLANEGMDIDLATATACQRPLSPTSLPIAPSTSVGAPLTPEPAHSRIVRLPVLEAFVQEETSNLGSSFNNLHAVLILHFLSDLPALLERFERLGLDPRLTCLVRKPYRYPTAEEVRKILSDKGYRVEVCTASESTEEPARRALLELGGRLQPGERFLVVEDGGYITPMLHTNEFAGLRERCVGVVEQTTKGLRAIENVSPLKLPVISVAASRLKLMLEAADVGDALGFTLEGYFRNAIQKPLSVISTLVVGFGVVGSRLALSLQQRGSTVSIYDRDVFRQIEARVQRPGGFRVLEALDDLSGYDLVVGTTGGTSIPAPSLLTASEGTLFASGSSDRLEIDLAGLLQHVKAPYEQNIEIDGLVTYYTLTSERRIGVLCDGYPINFVMGDGISKGVIDPILAELVAGALMVCRQALPAGIHELPRDTEESLWELYKRLTGTRSH